MAVLISNHAAVLSQRCSAWSSVARSVAAFHDIRRCQRSGKGYYSRLAQAAPQPTLRQTLPTGVWCLDDDLGDRSRLKRALVTQRSEELERPPPIPAQASGWLYRVGGS